MPTSAERRERTDLAIARIEASWPTIFPLWHNRFAAPVSLWRGALTVAVQGEDIGRGVAACEGLAERASAVAGISVRRIKVLNINQRGADSRRDCPIQRSRLRRVLGDLGCGHSWKGGLNVSKHSAASMVRKAADLLRQALEVLDDERAECVLTDYLSMRRQQEVA